MTTIPVHAKPAPALPPDVCAAEALRLMHHVGLSGLPLIDMAGVLRAVVTAATCERHIATGGGQRLLAHDTLEDC